MLPQRDLAHSSNMFMTPDDIYVTLETYPYVIVPYILCHLLMTFNQQLWRHCHRIDDHTFSCISILFGRLSMSSANMLFAFLVTLCFLASTFAFNMRPSTITRNVARIKMEYIPDGVSKEQVRMKSLSVPEMQGYESFILNGSVLHFSVIHNDYYQILSCLHELRHYECMFEPFVMSINIF